MYSYLVDIVAGAIALLPYMLQIRTSYQHQVVIANHLARVAHNATNAWGMLYEVKFEYLMVMNGIGELFFMSFGNIEYILSRQLGNLMDNLAFYHILNFQFFENLRHTLHVIDSHGHQWQTEHILDKAHLRKHGLHTCRVAINKQQREEIGKTMMDSACRIVLAAHLQTDHTRELLWQRITNNRDDTYGATANHRECKRIVARDHVEIGRFVLDNLINLLQITTGLLDSYDILTVASQANSSCSLKVYACTTRHIRVEFYSIQILFSKPPYESSQRNALATLFFIRTIGLKYNKFGKIP